jgi:hypothetical protein
VLNTGFTYLGESPKRGGICCVSGKWSPGAPAFLVCVDIQNVKLLTS